MKPILFKDNWKENKLFQSRLIVSLVIAISLFLVLVTQLYQLQIVNYQEFSDLSQGNRLKLKSLAPTRGLIKDRNGIILAENVPNWELVIIPEEVDDLNFTLNRLIALKLLDVPNIDNLEKLISSHRQFETVVLSNLTDEQVAIFASRRHQFSGVGFREGLKRYYPYNELASHAIGYVSSISIEDLEYIDKSEYVATSVIGKTGIERSFENELFGFSGYHHEIVNAQGRVFYPDSGFNEVSLVQSFDTRLAHKLPESGKNIIISIDSELQKVAEKAMDGFRGAVVVLDTNNGDILSMVSSPSYDLNLLSDGISRADFLSLSENQAKPLFNRALSGLYPPGSIVKPFIGLGALEHDVVNAGSRSVCLGHFTLPNQTHRYRDWKITGHGPVNLTQAIAESCDVYFYELAVNIGIEGINDYLESFGFGEKLGVNFSSESEGIVPSRKWKEENFRNPEDKIWYPGETVITGIGQGFTLTTPMQIAFANSLIANQGIGFRPRMVIGYEDSRNGRIELIENDSIINLDIKKENWDIIREAMKDVVADERGTGFSVLRDIDYSIAGKTGTVQVFSIGQDEFYEEENIDESLRDHGIFMAFAPYEKPEISIAVVIENMGSSSVTAVPVAKQILDFYFNNRRSIN